MGGLVGNTIRQSSGGLNGSSSKNSHEPLQNSIITESKNGYYISELTKRRKKVQNPACQATEMNVNDRLELKCQQITEQQLSVACGPIASALLYKS
jgi:hypothetical protein